MNQQPQQTAQPPVAAAKLKPPSMPGALREQGSVHEEIAQLRRDVAAWQSMTAEALRELRSAVTELTRTLVDIARGGANAGEPEDRLTPQQRAAWEAAKLAPPGKVRETIRAVQIFKGVDERNGETVIRVRGGRFMQHGVPVYPEACAALGIDAETLRFGPTPFAKDMIVELEPNDGGEMKPRRVIGLA